MAGPSSSSSTPAASLKETPTWAVAVVCSFLIIISLLIEHALHLLTMFLKRREKKSLNQALNKIKAELMLLGFISLLLTITEQPIAKICIPKSMGSQFLPCKVKDLPSNIQEEATCQEKDKISLLSRTAVNQLHILIFVLAISHVLSTLLTLGLGIAKMKRWESWEEETRTLEYRFSHDPRRFKLTRQTSFGRRHLKCWSMHPLLLWPVCFLRLFTGSISKADYFALRHGFIAAHMSEGSKFDFQKFLRRALDQDFEVVVGSRLWIWAFSALFIFFNAYGFNHHFWLPFIPLMMALAVGTKLQFIITKMCLESKHKYDVVCGTVVVKPNDNLFWFSRPQLLIRLIHFILFQNSFHLAFFSWTWYEFGLRDCFHETTEDIVIGISMGIIVQLLVGYVILPLYGLVTQMGSSMKTAVFTDRVSMGLKNWHAMAKRSLAPKNSNSTAPSPRHLLTAPSPRHSPTAPSPRHLLTAPSPRHLPTAPSPRHLPSVTLETLLSNEFEMREVERPLPDMEHERVEIAEEKETKTNTNRKPSFDGEISFGW